MNKKRLYISIVVAVVVILALLYKHKYNDLTYEEFFEKTDGIIAKLSTKYTRINRKDYTFTIPYYGNVNGKWSSDKGDIIGDNPLKSKKNVVYFIDDSNEIITKVAFYYNTNINKKDYLSVNVVDNLTNEFLVNNYELPIIYNSNFTDNNMFVEITSFAIYSNTTRKDDNKVGSVLRKITTDTQNILLGNTVD